jgi:hypothetical protein
MSASEHWTDAIVPLDSRLKDATGHAAMLCETLGVLHGAQIPETPSGSCVLVSSPRSTPSNQCPHDQPKRDLYQLETWCNRTCIRCAGACPPRISSSSALCTARPLRYAADAATWMNQFGELRQIADSRNDILAEAAGITAGSWYAWPSAHVGYELIAAGMLILAGDGRGFPFDYDELERWTRVGYERVMRSRKGER